MVSFKYLYNLDAGHFFSKREETYSANLILVLIHSSDLEI